MLVLSRKRNQSIVIGDQIVVAVLDIFADDREIHDAKVCLGFEAPRDVPIYRHEIYHRMNAPPGKRGTKKRAEPTPGKTVEISAATVRLRIQAPDVSIHMCDRMGRLLPTGRILSTPEFGSSLAGDSQSTENSSSFVLRCRKDERILIDESIVIIIVSMLRFIKSTPMQPPHASHPVQVGESR